MKSILVLVADKRELSRQVSEFLELHNITILYTGIGKDSVIRALLNDNLSHYDEVWSIGSVGSKLPVYSVFEVGYVYSEDDAYKLRLSDSLFGVKTVSSFTSISTTPPLDPNCSFDMELSHIVYFVIGCWAVESLNIKLRAFKYVSDNMTEDFTIDDWYKTIDETAFIVSEPLIKLIKKHIL